MVRVPLWPLHRLSAIGLTTALGTEILVQTIALERTVPQSVLTMHVYDPLVVTDNCCAFAPEIFTPFLFH